MRHLVAAVAILAGATGFNSPMRPIRPQPLQPRGARRPRRRPCTPAPLASQQGPAYQLGKFFGQIRRRNDAAATPAVQAPVPQVVLTVAPQPEAALEPAAAAELAAEPAVQSAEPAVQAPEPQVVLTVAPQPEAAPEPAVEPAARPGDSPASRPSGKVTGRWSSWFKPKVSYAYEDANDYYAILRVDETAPYSAIRSAFKKRIVTCHPDVDKSPEAAAEFRRVVDAHECLKDEKARSAYDGTRAVAKFAKFADTVVDEIAVPIVRDIALPFVRDIAVPFVRDTAVPFVWGASLKVRREALKAARRKNAAKVVGMAAAGFVVAGPIGAVAAGTAANMRNEAQLEPKVEALLSSAPTVEAVLSSAPTVEAVLSPPTVESVLSSTVDSMYPAARDEGPDAPREAKLRRKLRRLGLDTKGDNDELVARLRAAEQPKPT